MARTPAQAKALEAKALKSENKSEGMRMLLQDGYTVQEVRDVFEAPYGFVYGVARRAGLVDSTPREAKPAKAASPASPPSPKAKASPASPAAPATKAAKVAPKAAAKVAPRARVARTATRKASKS